MAIAVFSGFAASFLAPVLNRIFRGSTGWLLSLLPISILIYFLSFSADLVAGNVIKVSYAWAPSLGVNLSFYLDGLSLLFVILIAGIGAFIAIYAGGYLEGHPLLGRFYAYLLMFMASMIGVALADNLFSLFVFWELTSVSSYLLIGFDHEQEKSRKAALQAFLVTGSGGLAMLAGFILLNQAGGTTEISELLNRGDLVRSHAYYLPALFLVLIGAFTKSAQAPFHFWLPNAMEAPTPVSAYLHSATMVKAGVYLLARFSLVLGGTQVWVVVVTTVGLVTMLVGAYLALHNTNLKRILAYSTVSSLGVMVLLLGIGVSGAVKAAIVFLVAHALYKGALFMIAGIIYHETGTQDVQALGGLRWSMPITTVIAVLAAVSLSGLGPVLSFIGKELLFEAVIENRNYALLFTPAAVLVSAVSVAVALILIIRPFFGRKTQTPKHPHETPLSMWIGPAFLAVGGLAIGLLPAKFTEFVITPAITAILGFPIDVVLALWHGFNLALGLSAVAITSGFGVYFLWARLRNTTSWLERYLAWGPDWFYAQSLDRLNLLARFQTSVLQSGVLHHYLIFIITTTVILGGYTLISRVGFPFAFSWPVVRFYEIGLGALILSAALVAVRSKSRLMAVAALGVVGYSVALVFIFFGAPDLAMTQILIETMTVILMVLVLYLLPGFASYSTRSQMTRDIVVSIGAGALITALVLVATSVQEYPPISTYFVENSYILAHGRNIVNVILVDFRSIDTLGEITVLSMAGIGVYALLKLSLEKGRKRKR
jgi:multicomponent Na+:H+ antiporter subunit A